MADNNTVIISAEQLAKRFQWPEYLVFGIMLGVSAAIGIFYGCVGGKQKTTSEFFSGNKQMGVFPMTMSLIASFMSAITLLGTPAEMYLFGTEYWMIGVSYFFVMPAAAYLYMPVFFKLDVTSAYEYLEIRFHKSVRILGSLLFTIQMCLYMAIVVYAPALALAQVTGMDVDISVGVIFAVCTFYTAIGGIKAVMWTDAFQVTVMFGAMLAVIIKGNYDAGGIGTVWQRNLDSGRINFLNFDPNPLIRHTFWSLVVGGYFTWITIYGVNQAQVQRYLTVPSLKKAQIAIWFNILGIGGLLSVCAYGGLVIYAKYHKCDPIKFGLVEKKDQLFPLFVMDTLGELPGVPGLFVAGIFSGALSTVSSGLNSLAAITLEDFIKGVCVKSMSDHTATKISKVVAILYGGLCYGLVFLAKSFGGVLEAALGIFGMVGGPLLGVFTLGMFFPWANSIGAFTGTLVGVTFTFWIGIGTILQRGQGLLPIPKMPVSVEGCPLLNSTISSSINETLAAITTEATITTTFTIPDGEAVKETAFPLYWLSYMWYSAAGCFSVIIIGLLVSILTGLQDPRELDPRTICSVADRLCCYMPRKCRKFLRFHVGENYYPSETEKTVSNGWVGENGMPGQDNPAFDSQTSQQNWSNDRVVQGKSRGGRVKGNQYDLGHDYAYDPYYDPRYKGRHNYAYAYRKRDEDAPKYFNTPL